MGFLAVIRTTRSRGVGVVNTGSCFLVCLVAYLDALGWAHGRKEEVE